MDVEIEQVFLHIFQTQAFGGLPVVYENTRTDFDPSVATPHIELRAFPNETQADDLATTVGTTGLFQFTIVAPLGEGAMQWKQLRKTIFDHFGAGKRIVHNEIALDIVQNMPFITDEDNERGIYPVVGRLVYRANRLRT